MLTRILIVFLILLITGSPYAQQTATLKKTIELVIPGSGGSNGASVAWHPVHKKYYASMAGNAGFPFAVFDSKGTRVSDEEMQTLEDVRGLWYNPDSRNIQANCYSDHGWIEYITDEKGIPTEIKYLLQKKVQPDDQSAGAYDSQNKLVFFLDEMGYVAAYQYPEGEQVKEFPLHLGKTSGKTDADDNEALYANYNSTALICTGLKKAEIGVLNFSKKQVELYDMTTGYLTRILKLPPDAPSPARLNFSYSNGIVFLFDQTERVWKGYK